MSIQEILPYLTTPGNGVYTVFTAQERRYELQKKLYNAVEQEAEKKWQQQLQQLDKTNTPAILGICSDTGGGIMRGANWGPLFVRLALYQQFPELALTELGDVRVIPQLLLDEYVTPDILRRSRKALYQDENSTLAVSPLSITFEVAQWFYKYYPQRFLFGIGGDHSCSYPLVRAFLQDRQTRKKRAAVIHFDAHTDMMVERLGIPVCFGSWTYHILPYLPDPSCLVQIGIRASGRMRAHWESTYNIRQFWAHDIQENGAQAVIDEVIAHLKRQQIEEVYLTFDIDALDAQDASATGTPETDGIKLADALMMINTIHQHFKISAGDIMEVAPFVKFPDKSNQADEPTRTLTAAAKIAAAILR
jgi:agmatinase